MDEIEAISGSVVQPDTATLEGRLCAEWLRAQPSPGTRKVYLYDLQEFVAWLMSHRDLARPIFTVTRDIGNRYSDHLIEKGLADATVARKLSAISSFFMFCEGEGYLDRNVFARVRRPAVDKAGRSETLTLAEARALLTAAEQDGARNHLAVALMLSMALRAAEVCSIRWADLGTFGGHRTVWVTGKGGKRVEMPLSPIVIEAVERQEHRDGWLLPGGSAAGNLDTSSLGYIVKRLARVAGIGHRVHCHALRTASINLALESGAPIHRVQTMSRHASLVTVETYLRRGQTISADHAVFSLSALLAAG